MKRGSLIAPLLLILIGAAFLIRNIWPDWPLVEILATWWPFILIGWGLLRVAELIYLHQTGRKLPVSGISGGEWALIIILTVIGSTVWGVQRFSREGFGKFRIGGVEVFGESFDYNSDPTQYKTGRTPRVFVENMRGTTRIVGADVQEVRVTARKTVRAMDKATADRAHEKTPMKVDVSETSVSIVTNQDRTDEARISSDLEITVPAGASVEVRGSGADIDVNNIGGEVTISAEKGALRAVGLGAALRADVRNTEMIRIEKVKGNVSLQGRGRDIEMTEIGGEVEISGAYSGETLLRHIEKPVKFSSAMTDFQVERVPGEVNLNLSDLTCTNVVGPLTLKAKSKDIRLTDVVNAVNIDVDRGDVTLVQPKLPISRIDVQTRSGDIEVALPPGAKINLNAETVRGEIVNDFSDKLSVETRERGAQLNGAVGQGPEVKLQTSRGQVTIRKSDVGERSGVEPAQPPKPPAPPKIERATDQ